MKTNCTMGVGCDESGVCYAKANGKPEQCMREWPNGGKDPLEGRRGMLFNDAEKLIIEQCSQAGRDTENFTPASWNILHRVAQAAHKAGAEGMQALKDQRIPRAYIYATKGADSCELLTFNSPESYPNNKLSESEVVVIRLFDE